MAQALAYTARFEKAGLLSTLGHWVEHSFTRIAENNPRLKRVRRLQAMTDPQLAEQGIARDEIVHVVFRDSYYWRSWT